MKVNQIVGEHKKGFKANIYRKKKVIAPQSTEIKPMEEDAKITKSDQQGVEITADSGIKTILPADKATALAPDPQNPNEYDLNPAAVNPGSDASSGPTPPKVGASVEMKTAEDGSADADGPGYSFDSAKNFKDALSKTIGSSDPEVNAHLDSLIVAEPDGTVDVDQTLYNMVKEKYPELNNYTRAEKMLDMVNKENIAKIDIKSLKKLILKKREQREKERGKEDNSEKKVKKDKKSK